MLKKEGVRGRKGAKEKRGCYFEVLKGITEHRGYYRTQRVLRKTEGVRNRKRSLKDKEGDMV